MQSVFFFLVVKDNDQSNTYCIQPYTRQSISRPLCYFYFNTSKKKISISVDTREKKFIEKYVDNIGYSC